MIDLYTARTSNGQRVSIMLEECGLPYCATAVDLANGEHLSSALLTINPVGQIPAIRDPDGPDGQEVRLAESIATVRYLSDKSGYAAPRRPLARAECDRWCAIIATGIQPNFSAIHYARAQVGEAAAALIATFEARIARYLPVMDGRLVESEWLGGDSITIADLVALPVIATSLPAFGFDLVEYPAIRRWRNALLARPAVQRGLAVPG